MNLVAWLLLLSPLVVATYAYAIYPLLLRLRRNPPVPADTAAEVEWPYVSISLPVYNEGAQIRDVLESLLRLDYPRERLQILVISDGSTDGTDAAVRDYAGLGIEFLRRPERQGKTAAETAGAALLRGVIVVNTDASVRIAPDALQHIVRPFADPEVGLVSGRDISVAREERLNAPEAHYVDYEMRVRALETAAGGIIGASGCFYAIRSFLHRDSLPDTLSRDFASALIAREHGFRALSADNAVCFVPRTGSPRREYRRKVRTIMRGMETLSHKRHLLHPREGAFAWKLFSHKICRWSVPWCAVPALVGLALLARTAPGAAAAAGSAVLLASCTAVITWYWGEDRRVPRPLVSAGAAVLANIAVLHASIGALRGSAHAMWEPTRREPALPYNT